MDKIHCKIIHRTNSVRTRHVDAVEYIRDISDDKDIEYTLNDTYPHLLLTYKSIQLKLGKSCRWGKTGNIKIKYYAVISIQEGYNLIKLDHIDILSKPSYKELRDILMKAYTKLTL